MGEGRFGPLYRAHAADGAAVVVRTFIQAVSSEQRERLAAELAALCQRPLDHPSIARPIASGIQHDYPYLVHTYLPGTPLSGVVAGEVMAGSRRLAPVDIGLRLTYLAGALDFAAAVGVLHGALTAADVIFSEDNAGVSGFGLVQALEAAGLDGFHARREDDVAALMGIARQLLGDRVPPAARAVLSSSAPSTALEFAAELQQALEELPIAPAFDFESESDQREVDLQPQDFPLQDDFPTEREPAIDPMPPTAMEPASAMMIDPAPVIAVDPGPMRPADRAPVMAAPMFGATADEIRASSAVQRRGGRGWLVTAVVALVLGVLAGFGGGLFMARDAPAPAPVPTAPTPRSEPANDQPFTDAPVDTPPAGADATRTPAATTTTPAPSRPTTVAPTAQPRPPNNAAQAPAAAARPPRAAAAQSQPSGPAAMRVDSLPPGAQVFVDGRSVGYAPLVVGDLTPGTHSIRLQLPGYRPWVNAVTLGPGARERVSASLEQ